MKRVVVYWEGDATMDGWVNGRCAVSDVRCCKPPFSAHPAVTHHPLRRPNQQAGHAADTCAGAHGCWDGDVDTRP
eukprot:94698-Chlamydomonas_euryale.AAC.1